MRVGEVVSCLGILILLGCVTGQVRTAEVSGLKLSFIIDEEYDIDNLVWIFRHDDPSGLESRAASMGIDADTARKIRDSADASEARALADKLVANRFEKNDAAIGAARNDLEASWGDVLAVFSKVVVEITGSPWVHSEYVCVVSSIFPGLSNWSGNKVAVRFDYASSYRRRILAHEILLSDVFQLLRKRHASSEISDWQAWAFSEITPGFILDDPRLRPYWPDVPRAGAYSGYAQLAGLEKQLGELFDHRKSYSDYEEKSVGILKGFQPSLGADRALGWLGVFVGSLQEKDSYLQMARDMGLADAKGALVLGLYKGSPADSAGLMAGDCVTAVGSAQIEDAGQFTRVIGSLAAGTKIPVTLFRQGEQETLVVTIGEPGARAAVALPRNLWPGFTVTDITDDFRKTAGSPEGVRGVVVASITGGQSPAGAAGLKLGDIVTAVNGIKVGNLRDFYGALNAKGGRGATLEIAREGSEVTLAF